MGNSRAWLQYSPQILDTILHKETYNLGIDGSPINRQVCRYNLYRKYNSKPSVIIQNIDFLTMDYRIGYERNQFFPYFWNIDFRKAFFEIEPFSFLEKYIPFYRYFHFGIMNMSDYETRLEKGYLGRDSKWDGSILAEMEPLRFKPDSRSVSIFESYLEEAYKEGIKVIFVYAPMYSGATEKLLNLDEMYSFYSTLAEKYDIPIIDFNFDDICSDTTYFYNATHLNRTGAEIFSNKLGKEIYREMLPVCSERKH